MRAGQYNLGLKQEERMLGGDSLKVRTCWDSERSVTSPARMLAGLITVEINISVGCRSACFSLSKSAC